MLHFILEFKFLARHPAAPLAAAAPIDIVPAHIPPVAADPDCPSCKEELLPADDIIALQHHGSAIQHRSHRACSMAWFRTQQASGLNHNNCLNCNAPLTEAQRIELGLTGPGDVSDIETSDFVRASNMRDLDRSRELLVLNKNLANIRLNWLMFSRTILMKAVMDNNHPLAALLIRYDANVNAEVENSWTALHYACKYYRNHAMFEILINAGANPNIIETWSNQTPLEMICKKDNHVYALDIARLLLNIRGINVHLFGTDTPLQAACKAQNLALVQLLLASGANPLLANGQGKTAWRTAQKIGNKEIINAFVEATSTPLHRACKDGNLTEVTDLLAGSANVNATTIEGTTPMWYACRYGRSEIATLLMTHGAQRSLKEYAMLLAIKHGSRAVASIRATAAAATGLHNYRQ